jgi:hypothetical protein
MGSTAGTIQGSFGWDNNPLLKGMQESEQIVSKGAARIENRLAQAEKRFTSLFRRSPHRRAELAVSGLASSLASGDVAGGIAQIAHRMSGLGIAAGVGVGVAAALFEKFHKQIEETKQAHEALLVEMGKRPVSIVTSLSSEGMEQALQSREKLVEDLRKKSEHTFGSELAETFKSLLVGPSLGAIGGKDNGRERMQTQEDINKAIGEGKVIMEAQAKLAETLVGIRRQELEGDERGAEIAKIALRTDQARAALKLKGLTATAFRTAEKAILEDEELSFHQADKKANVKEAELKMTERIVALQHKGLTGDDLKRVRAGLDIQRLDEQIAGEKSPQIRRGLLLERAQKVNEAHDLLGPAGHSNPFPWGTPASRDFERQFGYRGLTKQPIEDSLGFGGLARRSIERGDSLTPEEALLKTGTNADDIAAYRKNVGDLPGEKGSNPELVGVMTDIRNIIQKAWAE